VNGFSLFFISGIFIFSFKMGVSNKCFSQKPVPFPPAAGLRHGVGENVVEYISHVMMSDERSSRVPELARAACTPRTQRES